MNNKVRCTDLSRERKVCGIQHVSIQAETKFHGKIFPALNRDYASELWPHMEADSVYVAGGFHPIQFSIQRQEVSRVGLAGGGGIGFPGNLTGFAR